MVIQVTTHHNVNLFFLLHPGLLHVQHGGRGDGVGKRAVVEGHTHGWPCLCCRHCGDTRSFLLAPHLQARVLSSGSGSEPLGHAHLRARGEDFDGHLHGLRMELVAVHTDNIGLVPVLLVHRHSSKKWHISCIKLRLGNTTGTACTNSCAWS